MSDEDARAVAILLLTSGTPESEGIAGNSGSAQVTLVEESGYMRWTVGNQSYRISLDDWRKTENWRAGQELLNQCFDAGMISIGSVDGWQPISDKTLADKWPLYFPGYQLLTVQDMTQTGTTVAPVFLPQILQLSEETELIEVVSGRRISVACRQTDQGLEITPQETLPAFQTYWLVITNETVGDDGVIAVFHTVEDSGDPDGDLTDMLEFRF
jgi:hypothetical protein